MNKTLRTTALAACAAILALAGTMPATAEPNVLILPDGVVLSGTVDLPGVDLVVASGSTAYFADLHLTVNSFTLLGDLQAVETGPDAPSISISAATGMSLAGGILGRDGQSYGWTTNLEGRDGGDGTNIILSAPTITLEDTVRLVPGNGGYGESVHATRVGLLDSVQGGNGGDAGWLVFLGELPHVPSADSGATLLGAVGGPGGALTAPAGALDAQLHVGEPGQSAGILTGAMNIMPKLPGTFHVDLPELDGGGRLLDGCTAHPYDCIPDGVPEIDCLANWTSCNPLGEGPCPVLLDCIPDGVGGICDDAQDCLFRLIAPTGLCDGFDGVDVSTNGAPGNSGVAGTAGAPGTVQGGAGTAGTDGTAGHNAGGDARGGPGGPGCVGYGCGGDGGDASANGGDGGAGGHGGAGGASEYGVGGDGGAGGNGANGGNHAQATAGKAGQSFDGCSLHGTPGVDGAVSMKAGSGGAGGTGGLGGHGFAGNGANGPNGSSGSNGN